MNISERQIMTGMVIIGLLLIALGAMVATS